MPEITSRLSTALAGRLLLVVVLAVAPLTNVSAQDPLPVTVGTRVRVTAPELDLHKYDGILRAMDSDTLIVDHLRVALPSVTRLDVHAGMKSNAGKGALYTGFSFGLIFGGLLGSGCTEPNIFDCTFLEGFAAGFGVGFLGGALIGGVIGALIMTDRWEEVPLDQFRVSFGPHRDGRFAFGLSVRF